MRHALALLSVMLLASCGTLPTTPTFAETQQLRAACPAERAVYTLPDSAAELRLVKTDHPVNADSNLAIRAEAERQVFWFSMTQSNGYGRMFTLYINDPTTPNAEDPLELENAPSDNDLVLFDTDLKTLPIPQAGNDAPAYLVAPGIGPRFWYDAASRVSVPVGMWRLTACAP